MISSALLCRAVPLSSLTEPTPVLSQIRLLLHIKFQFPLSLSLGLPPAPLLPLGDELGDFSIVPVDVVDEDLVESRERDGILIGRHGVDEMKMSVDCASVICISEKLSAPNETLSPTSLDLVHALDLALKVKLLCPELDTL